MVDIKSDSIPDISEDSEIEIVQGPTGTNTNEKILPMGGQPPAKMTPLTDGNVILCSYNKQNDIYAFFVPLLENYKDSVLDISDDTATIQCPELKLQLVEGEVRPAYSLGGKPTPVHLRRLAEAELEDYIKKGYLVKLLPNELTDWMSPAFWVEKKMVNNKPNGARLVIDYRILNQYLSLIHI